MNSRSNRAEFARHTLQTLESGYYTNDAGEDIYIGGALGTAMKLTTLYEPAYLQDILKQCQNLSETANKAQTRFEVRPQTTLDCAYHLFEKEDKRDLFVLNFASAKNPGGGFLGGSLAQEESLATASGLYYCLTTQPKMYTAHKQGTTSLYTDHMIYSPGVPVFKDDKGNLLDDFYTIDILSSPAVNKGAIQQNEPHNLDKIAPVMLSRIEKVLAVALASGHKTLILGAWGCGVFRNDPEVIAGLFAEQLFNNPLFSSAFEHVVFAIPSNKDDKTLNAFDRYFGGRQ